MSTPAYTAEQLVYTPGFHMAENYVFKSNGFIEPITKELPMEYAVELTRLIQLEMSGSVG